MPVAGGRPSEPVDGKPPSPAVSDVLDHDGKQVVAPGRAQVPGLDGVAGEPGEGTSPPVHVAQHLPGAPETEIAPAAAGLPERASPNPVESAGPAPARP